MKKLKIKIKFWFSFLFILTQVNYAMALGDPTFAESKAKIAGCQAESSLLSTLTCNGVLVGAGCAMVGSGSSMAAGTAMASAMTGAATAGACTLVIQGEQATCKAAMVKNNECYNQAQYAVTADRVACIASCPAITLIPVFCDKRCTATATPLYAEVDAGIAKDQTTDATYTAMGAAALAGLAGLLSSSLKSKGQLESRPVSEGTLDTKVSDGTGTNTTVSDGLDTKNDNTYAGAGNANNGITSGGSVASFGAPAGSTLLGGVANTGGGGTSDGRVAPSGAKSITTKACGAGDIACVCAASGKYTVGQCQSVVNKFGLGGDRNTTSGFDDQNGSRGVGGLGSASNHLGDAGSSSGGGSNGGFSGVGGNSGAVLAKTDMSTGSLLSLKKSSDDFGEGGSGYSGGTATDSDSNSSANAAAKNNNANGARSLASTLSSNAVLAAAHIAAKNGNLFDLISKRYSIECSNGKTMISGECIK